MKLVLIAGLGSFVGGAFRYMLSGFIQERTLNQFPWGTFIVNILGCFLIGCLLGLFQKIEISAEWKVFFVTGLLGGFTTFSAFSVETFNLFRTGYIAHAFLYVAGSLIVGVGLTCLGWFIVRQ